MRRSALAALAALATLSACSETVPDEPPPLDRFYFPAGLALAPRTAGGPALLVASANFDLRYGPKLGGSLLSVDPEASLGAADGALTLLGTSLIGSYAGQLTVADAASCPGLAAPVALVPSRYTRELYQIPLGADGELGPCGAGSCARALDPVVSDPYGMALACKADGSRQTAVVSYLTAPVVGSLPAGSAWLTEVDLAHPEYPLRTVALGSGPINDMAYDASADRLWAVGRFAGFTAPLFAVGLDVSCATLQDCPSHAFVTIDLDQISPGADLQGIALSNPVAGAPRRAYVSARLYDPDLARALGGRPSFDIGAVLLVLELSEAVSGQPRVRLVHAVDVEPGPGQVRVLPPRAGLRDVVVVSSAATGTITVYDDEVGTKQVITLDQATGAPAAGRQPFALAVRDAGTTAEVYVAAFDQFTVSVVDVPLAAPSGAALRRAAGTPLRMGKERQ